MELVLKKYGGVTLFYMFIILCIILVNARFETLNDMESVNQIVAINE